MRTDRAHTALTIAGFDPSSGAGITADLQVFAAHGVFGTAAITAMTVQSTVGVRRVSPADAGLLRETLETLQDDLPPNGIKIGMLGGGKQAAEVARYLRSFGPSRPRTVLDPVLRSSSGALLLDGGGLDVLREELLPLVDVVTPNASELEVLVRRPCGNDIAMREAAGEIAERWRCAVVVTGGDREKPDDLIFAQGAWTVLEGEHIETTATHGTGCAFSSALLCGLLRGESVEGAARSAKQYVAEAMRSATPQGKGKGPMHLLWPLHVQQRAQVSL